MAVELWDTPPDWEVRRLDEVATIIDSLHKTPTYSEVGRAMVRVVDVKGGFLDLTNAHLVSEEVFQEFTRRYAPRRGDIVFSRVGSYGNSSYAKTDAPFCLGQNTALISPRINGRFLHQFLQSEKARRQIEQMVVGSTQKTISLKSISALQIPIPPIFELESIASILGALDDKIDLNLRMNEALEAIARAIFKDWFVDFGPTRAKIEGGIPYLVPEIWALFPDQLDDEGKPEGWERSTVGAECALNMGQSPPGDTYNETGDGLPFFQGRRDFGVRYPMRRMYCSAPTRVAEVDDTLVSVRAPVGDLNMAWERCCIGRGVAAVRHRSGHRGYTFYAMSYLQPDLAAFEHTGTVFGAINKAQFEALAWTASQRAVVDAFEAFISPFDERVRSNEKERATLIALRDLLLAKLMSGEIRVKDAAKIIERAA
jgi:type I restriction enzyme S subunit